jgi:hypothetical protein
MKYGKITIEGKKIPEGEPLFLLRAQDRLAFECVRYYSELLVREANKFMGDEERYDKLMKAALEVQKIAGAMFDWPMKKLPD